MTTTKKRRRGTSGIVHGRPGIGKSTLLETLPKPALIVDAEHGDDEPYDDEITILKWEDWFDDEAGDGDREQLDNKTIVIITALDYWDYADAVTYIRSPLGRKFRSFGIDTLTKVQDLMEEELLPLNRTKIKARRRDFDHFGSLLDYMKADLEALHELTITRGLTTWWVCHTDREATPMVPQLTGQLRKKVARIPDIIGYLQMHEGLDEHGNSATWRTLDISASTEDSEVETKCRRRKVTKKWGGEIPEPNLARISAVASPRPKKRGQ